MLLDNYNLDFLFELPSLFSGNPSLQVWVPEGLPRIFLRACLDLCSCSLFYTKNKLIFEFFCSGYQVWLLGTLAYKFGCPKGSLEFILEHSLNLCSCLLFYTNRGIPNFTSGPSTLCWRSPRDSHRKNCRENPGPVLRKLWHIDKLKKMKKAHSRTWLSIVHSETRKLRRHNTNVLHSRSVHCLLSHVIVEFPNSRHMYALRTYFFVLFLKIGAIYVIILSRKVKNTFTGVKI